MLSLSSKIADGWTPTGPADQDAQFEVIDSMFERAPRGTTLRDTPTRFRMIKNNLVDDLGRFLLNVRRFSGLIK